MKHLLSILILLLSLAVPLMVVYQYGFPIDSATNALLNQSYRVLMVSLWVAITVRFVLSTFVSGNWAGWGVHSERHGVWHLAAYLGFTCVVVVWMCVEYRFLEVDMFTRIVTGNLFVVGGVLAVAVMEISRFITGVLSQRANPSLILASSFLFIILIGSMLMKLPRCTVHGIEYIDALFISASAVCVTGLTPLDLSTTLTTEGFVVLMLLIQVGGLGIMTITSFFGLFFMGGGSFANQLMISDLFSNQRMGGLLRVLLKIIVVTLVVEAVGAIIIYSIMMDHTGMSTSQAWFFAIFHAVSAFCNAGFSTFSANLYDPTIRDLSSLQYTISWLVIFGGIGFPIFANGLRYLGHKIRNMGRVLSGLRPRYEPHLWSLNSYIVIRMTMVLVLVPWVMMMFLEWDHSLAEFGVTQKISQGFLMAVTPRTAGFNGVDMSLMMPTTILLTMALMWIGGAPQSTAGGIKVTSLYLALRNVFTHLHMTDGTMSTLEVHRRQVGSSSVRRAYSVMTVSIVFVAMGTMVLAYLHPEIELSKLMFESFSAIGTVGLSIGVTPQLGMAGKLVVIVLMFVGRVSLVAILGIFIKQISHKSYSYPQEDILIN